MTTDLDAIERLAISIARSAGRLRVYVRMPNAPAVFIAHEQSLLERRLEQLHEVETFGSEPGWSAETIHE